VTCAEVDDAENAITQNAGLENAGFISGDVNPGINQIKSNQFVLQTQMKTEYK